MLKNGMGHIDGSVSACYAHVTPGMHKRLMLGLTEQWEAALDTVSRCVSHLRCARSNDLLRARQ